MLRDGLTDAEQSAVTAHLAYLKALVDEGTVLMAGRTLTNDETTFGIVILRAESEIAARALMRADPAVAAGVMYAELFPYRVALWSSTFQP